MEHIGQKEAILEFIRSQGIARSNDIQRAGFPRVLLSRLVADGLIERVHRGLYTVAEHEFTQWHDYAEVSRQVPLAVFNLISALAFHNIGTQVPHEQWIALPAGTWEPKVRLNLRTTWLTEPYYSAGLEVYEIEGVPVKVYSPAKTVADCFKMRSKVGYDVAIEALREGWRYRRFTMDELIQYAKLNRVYRVMSPYMVTVAS